MTVRRIATASALAATGLAFAAALARHPEPRVAPAAATTASLLGRLPLAFEANRGQWDGEALFRVAGRGGTAFVTRSGAVFALPGDPPEGAVGRPGLAPVPARSAPRREPAAFRMRVEGASAAARAEGLEELPGKANFFLGNDPARWRANVPTYAKARVSGVRPGVDVVYYGREGQLEYDFSLAPGVDPATVKLAFEGIDSLDVNADGDLLVRVAGREVLQRRPQVFEEGPEGRRALGAAYVLMPGNAVAFRVDGRDPARRLVIDPVIVFGTLLGGSGNDDAAAIGVDAWGDVLIAGSSYASGFPTLNALRSTFSGSGEGFVARVKADGSGLVYSTYLGGTGHDAAVALAVDAAGCPYVVGYSMSRDFPVVGAFQTSLRGSQDVFVAKLRADGSALVYSTLLGGESTDGATAIAVDGAGRAYVTGYTYSTSFPTLNPVRATLAGVMATFATKLTADGSALVYSTYLGGTTPIGGSGIPLTHGRAIAVDRAGSAYVAGNTYTSDFPTTAGAFQRTTGSGNGKADTDAFVAKLAPDGGALAYSTYLGGSDFETASGIAVDAAGSAYVVGYANSTDFPTAHALQAAHRGGTPLGYDAFVTRLTPDGSGLVFSTFLGGTGVDRASALALDRSGRILVTGSTTSTNFPTAVALQGTSHGAADAFLAKLEADGSALVHSTYLGGSGGDEAQAMAVDGAGAVYLAGFTASSDFPGTPAQARNAGGNDAFVLKLSGPTLRAVSPARSPVAGGTPVTLTGDQFVSGATVTIGGAAATSVTLVDAATLTAVAPAHAAGIVDVVVTNPGGAASTIAGAFTYAPAPAILVASPATGPMTRETPVTLGGSGFEAGATVTLGGAAATNVNVASASILRLTAPAARAAGPVDVVVTNPDGQVGTLRAGFTYVAPPSIARVSPASGPTDGGTIVTVTGAAFQSGATVAVGGTSATDVTVTSATSLTFKAPLHAAGTVDLVVTNLDGQSATRAAAYTYVAPPSIASVAPASGPVAGGTAVTVTGTAFQAGAKVALGGVDATEVNVTSATTLTAKAPAHAAGAVDVVVTNPDGQSATRAAAYTYVPPPSIANVAPASGQMAGGTPVAVTGTAFQAGARVALGGVDVTTVNVTSATSLTFNTPASRAAGTVDLVVTNLDGQSVTRAAAFTYVPPPSIASVAPASGPVRGGTSITVTGTAFQSGATVTLGGAAATNVNVASTTSLTATAPAASAPGVVDIVVTNPDGQSTTRAAAFTYVPPPSVATVAPASGSTAGGTIVNVTGAAFQSGARVALGGVDATEVNVTSATTLTAKAPEHAPGAVDVVVTNPDGQSVTRAAAYTYVPPPAVTAVEPPAGTSAGGTLVTLAGSGFQPGATVSFGGAASRLVTVQGDTRLTASTPQHPPGQVDVVVTNPDGQSVTVASGFTFFAGNAPAPTLRAAAPASGPAAGGTRVTLTGTGFQAGVAVSFGGALATAVQVDTGTSLTATTPSHAAGLVDVAVSNADGQSATLPRAFAYYPAGAPAPTITGVSPATGLEAGGWGVTVTGTGFMAGATVAFGGGPGTGVSVASATTLTATVPQHSTGSVDVVVTNPDGQSATLAGGLEYLRKGGSGCGYLGADPSLALLLGLVAARAMRLRRPGAGRRGTAPPPRPDGRA